MKINMRCFKALFKKDFKNTFMNKNIFLMILLPILFCVIYTKVLGNVFGGEGAPILLNMCTAMTLSVVPLNILPGMVAEEKEKHTLRSLMMANVSATDFLLSKAVVTMILTLIDSLAIYLLVGLNMAYLPLYLAFVTLTSFGLLFFGAFIGLLAKDQMNAGTLAVPLMLVLMLFPMLAQANELFKKLSVAFPTGSFQTLFFSLIGNQSLLSTDCLIAFGVAILWIVIGIVAFVFVYKKRGLND
ncbi:MAG: ABC transporter permease [Coprobacillus sp.]